MSESKSHEDSEDDGPKMTEEEIVKMVSDKVFEAFKTYDPDGDGGQIKTEFLRDVLDYCELSMNDQEMYKLISDLDPS